MWRSGGYVPGRGVFLGNLLHKWGMPQGLPGQNNLQTLQSMYERTLVCS